MSNVIRFSTARRSFRDTAAPFHFHLTKVAKIKNETSGVVQDAIVDLGSCVTLIPDQNMLDFGKKKLAKAMIEKFRALNGGVLPMFRMEGPVD